MRRGSIARVTAPDADLTIDQLAARAGMTVRNIRSHVSRGLLPPPQLRGRTAYYDSDHLARLQLIAGLQQQGFSLAAIEAVVRQTPARSAEQALAFYRGILAPWQPEDPRRCPTASSRTGSASNRRPRRWIGCTPTASSEPLGGGRVRITNPALLRAGAQTVRLGIPVEAVLALRPELVRHVRAIAELFVGLFRDTMWREHVARGMPSGELAEVRRVVEELQPVAAQALLAAFRSAMPEAIEAFVREQLAGGAQRNGQ